MPITNEILIDFTDEFIRMSDSFKMKILSLQSPQDYGQAINDLFRQIHSLKAISQYAKIDPLHQLLSTLEDVFQILRYRQRTLKPELINWLCEINDQFAIWADSFEHGEFDIEPADPYLLNMIKISSVSSIKKSHTIKDRTVLLYAKKASLVTLFTKISPLLKRLMIVQSLKECEEKMEHEQPDFVFASTECGMEELILLQQIATLELTIPYIPIITAEREKTIQQFALAGITTYIDQNITPKVLIQTLLTRSKQAFDSTWISFSNDLISEKIDRIEPLPEVISKVQQLVASEEATTRDVANLLQNDPLLTTKILQTINNPTYGLKQPISTLHHAVSLLGKSAIGALALQEKAQSHFASVELQIYGIEDQRELYAIAKKRMDLIVRWYSKIDVGMLSILATTALLGNIGIFILADAAKTRKLEADFIQLSKTSGYRIAEVELFNMSAEEITAAVFDHWNLSPLIADTIRYSYDFENAPDAVRPYSLANFIVNMAIDYPGRGKEREKFEDVVAFLKVMGFDESKFLAAYHSVIEAV